MKNEKKELEVIVVGKPDLRKIPKEYFDAFISAIEEEICKLSKLKPLKADSNI